MTVKSHLLRHGEHTALCGKAISSDATIEHGQGEPICISCKKVATRENLSY